MTKKIIIRNGNGNVSTHLNRPGGHNVVNYNSNNSIKITDEDLNSLYNNFIKPYVNQGPFYMGPTSVLNDIYTRIYIIIESSFANKNNQILLMFRDVLTILVQSRDIYFDNIKFQNEINVLRVKYQISENKIFELTQKLLECEQSHEDGSTKNLAFTGSLGIKVNQPKNLIYAQAILNINLAWYYYLHMKKVIDPKIYMATVQYVKMMGNNAYNNLITLLDEKYKSIDNLIQNQIQNQIENQIITN